MNPENLGIGKIITTQQKRDAIHVAIAPVVAAQNLRQGQHVTLFGGKAAIQGTKVGYKTVTTENIGIVDPFLLGPIRAGEPFWLFLYPGSITSLRHEWLHPAFQDKDGLEAKAWLEHFATTNDLSYEELITIAESEFGVREGQDLYCNVPPEFWVFYELATGKAPLRKHEYFSCSC